MIEIREILPAENELYQTFFKQGLLEDEENFRISPNDPAVFPSKGTEYSFTLGAFSEGQLAGVVSFEREGASREKLAHKGMLIRMLVSKSHRGKGIGRKLISSLLDRVKTLEYIEQVNLTLAAQNDSAKGLYQSFGFQTYGLEKNAIKWKGKYYNEELMALILIPSE